LIIFTLLFMPPQEPAPENPRRRRSRQRTPIGAGPDDLEFEQALEAVERSLDALKQRYNQVQADQLQQAELQERLEQLQQTQRDSPLPHLRRELRGIQRQLEDLEVALESRLFSWSGMREVFWQIIRFGGLGTVIGWILRSCAA
jgi:hypothetical protein